MNNQQIKKVPFTSDQMATVVQFVNQFKYNDFLVFESMMEMMEKDLKARLSSNDQDKFKVKSNLAYLKLLGDRLAESKSLATTEILKQKETKTH